MLPSDASLLALLLCTCKTHRHICESQNLGKLQFQFLAQNAQDLNFRSNLWFYNLLAMQI